MNLRSTLSLSQVIPQGPLPARYFVSRRRWPQDRHFHTSRTLYAQDHYAVLGLQPGATVKEIKQSFYSLSKTHHPDRNPDNREEASQKFAAISDSYHVLNDPQKREKYDREHQQQQSSGAASYSPGYGGSGFSSGARKASGLSKRRGTFRGPPPSFYRSGGWGASSEKRGANMNADASNADTRRRQQQEQAQQQRTYGGTGSWPFTTDHNDVYHFDREGHFKTQTSVEDQLQKGRRQRRSAYATPDNMAESDSSGGSVGQFILVFGTLAIGVGLPVLFFARVPG